jgi:hypothetical protein
MPARRVFMPVVVLQKKEITPLVFGPELVSDFVFQGIA